MKLNPATGQFSLTQRLETDLSKGKNTMEELHLKNIEHIFFIFCTD